MLRLIAGDELPDVLEKIERKVASFHVGEEAQADGVAEDPGRDAFFYQRRAGAVLRLVDLRVALPLEAQQRPYDRRPAQYGDVGEMKDVVEAVVISRHCAVGQPIADVDAARALKHIGL